ncbi:MAG: DNA repair protein RecN [Coriobacteriia bacterium]|nr:DNA repair protein RecN [Coriobacteriia bacterium]
MLSELHVRDLALVEDVWLEFGPGLTVLTGETGAGKTVLVEALKLLLGERADSAMVRQGAEEALVEGRFVIDGREVLVRRRVSAEGRSRCTVDGEMATVGMLAELLGGQVDLHGQHEHQALLSPARHAGYLDRFIGAEALVALDRYRDAHTAAGEAARALQALEDALADRGRREDYLRFQVADIDAAAPQAGEDAELTALLPRLRHGQRLTAAAASAHAAIQGEGGVSEGLTAATSALAAAGGLDPALDELADAVGRLDIEAQEVAASLRTYAESVEHDPAALDGTEHRLHELGDLMRKYGPALDDVLRTREEAAKEIELLDSGEAGIEQARAAVAQARERLVTAGEAIVGLRDGAVAAFVDGLRGAAADLALPTASFAVARTPLPETAWTADGPERVEFLFASGTGEEPRPLARVASGGEISRVMLALKSVLGAADAVPVLAFDEVDAGIGGATALAVGKRLARLAESHQVLVVTHLPQVAAYADSQVVVSKSEESGRTVTSAGTIGEDEREAEIARMLAGGASEAGLAHARELLTSAASERRAGG